MRHKVSFMVDDDPKFVRQMERLEIPTFWLTAERREEELDKLKQAYWPQGGQLGPKTHMVFDLEKIPDLATRLMYGGQ